jgi:uncharacterized protein YjiK
MMNRNKTMEAMPRLLKLYKAKHRPYKILVVLATGTCAVLAVMVLVFLYQPNSGTLADYQWSRSFRIPAIPRNLSGITYRPESGTLFLVSNTPTRVYEITTRGHLIRQIDLVGFLDTEDIVFVEKQTFAVIEEKRRTIIIFQIFPETKSVRYADCRRIQALPPRGGNTGLEGLAWDPDTRTFLISKENHPRAVYTVPFDSKKGAQEIPALNNLPWIKLGSYSGIYFDRVSCRLLILSRKSGKIKDYSLEGREKGSLNLFRFIHGIIRTEGLTIVPGGELYVSSEPDRVDVFQKRPGKKEMKTASSGDQIPSVDQRSAK